MALWRTIKLTASLIKIQHTVFALPFALVSLVVATRAHMNGMLVIKVVLAVCFARSAAMSFNRIIDRNIDEQNPRTAQRELPAGTLSLTYARWFCALSIILFLITCASLNRLSLMLSPLALLVILGYSYTKRFTSLTHLVLGLSLGIAPIAAWIAAMGTISHFSLMLGFAVMCWVAGFDIVYSTQDYDFDRSQNLNNLVVKLGITKALWCARGMHVLSFASLIAAGQLAPLDWPYHVGVAIMGGLMFTQHILVTPHDQSRVNMAFFTLNGIGSLALCALTWYDVLG